MGKQLPLGKSFLKETRRDQQNYSPAVQLEQSKCQTTTTTRNKERIQRADNSKQKKKKQKQLQLYHTFFLTSASHSIMKKVPPNDAHHATRVEVGLPHLATPNFPAGTKPDAAPNTEKTARTFIDN